MAGTHSKPYFEAFASLRGVYLEDSWILSVESHGDSVTFELDAVLTPEHASYEPPKVGEQYCYRSATLSLRGVDRFERSDTPPATDATGTFDFGNIDSFTQGDDGRWRAEGDWGELEADDPEVTLELAR